MSLFGKIFGWSIIFFVIKHGLMTSAVLYGVVACLAYNYSWWWLTQLTIPALIACVHLIMKDTDWR